MKFTVMNTKPPVEFAEFVEKFDRGELDAEALMKMLTDPNNYTEIEIGELVFKDDEKE